MTSGHIEVDTAELRRAANACDELVTNTATRVDEYVAAVGTVGGAQVAAVLGEFSRTWHNAITETHQNLATSADLLVDTAKAYEQVEDEITRAAEHG